MLTTHDLNGMAAHLPHLVCLNTEVTGRGTPREVLTPEVLERTYGAPMDVLEHGGMPIVVDAPELVTQTGARTPCLSPVRGERLMTWLTEPFEFAFFRHGLMVATMAGALCGLIGVYVTLRGMSYIGHGLSHAIFGGAAASALVGFNFYLGAGLWGMASALAIGRVTRRRIIGSDAAIGVITTASFAFGIALLGLYGQVRRSIDAAIFGSVLGRHDEPTCGSWPA